MQEGPRHVDTAQEVFQTTSFPQVHHDMPCWTEIRLTGARVRYWKRSWRHSDKVVGDCRHQSPDLRFVRRERDLRTVSDHLLDVIVSDISVQLSHVLIDDVRDNLLKTSGHVDYTSRIFRGHAVIVS